MKESYSESLANHTGLGSYADTRKGEGGTLIEVRAGRVLSREITTQKQGVDAVLMSGRQHRMQRMPMLQENPARSETPGMHGNILQGDREIPRSSAQADRVGKSKGERR
jgi:hypothetical protein